MPPSARPAALVAAVLLLAGCAGDPPTAPPTGVDGLVVPTPDPDPADFVEGIDNPWLPLAAGNTWVYEAGGGVTVTVVVEAGDHEVAGVAMTEVRTTREGPASDAVESVDWYAQDRAGNVWWFGTEGVWEAEVAGAEAGLAMPARPRVGDGFERQLAPGVAEERARVVDTDGDAAVPFGDLDGVLVLEETSALEPGRVDVSHHAPGVGLVLREPGDEEGERLELVDFTSG
ncbi:hypothetical protein [Nocardioides coralli]|uniref:hypothetical protein n=1 Tax=Nocardioides coralli TaxID=2872154 RepID=UPI001CA3D275|nr:hypothetical protein [Nocardioides coralli]QZY29894.1 hypothetical protein K6T13_04170 [Nocardioides coralli]